MMTPDYVFRNAIEATNTGIIICDSSLPDNPIIYANPYFQKLTGYSSEEICGRNCRFLQGPDSNQKTRDKIRLAINEKRLFVGEILNYRKNGTSFWNHLTISPIKSPDGKYRFFVGVQKDVTAQKTAEAKRDALIRDLKFINVGLSTFSSMASHEITSPLASIHGYANLLKEKHSPNKDKDYSLYVDRILANTNFVTDCINDLSLLTSLNYENPATNDVDLNSVIKEAIDLFICDHKNLEVKLDGPFPSKVNGNKILMLLIFKNLISNAIKYGKALEKGLLIKNNSRPDDDFFEVQVKDYGNGIPKEVRKNLFEPFVTTGRKNGIGSGLGLAIIKRTMEVFRGEVLCHSDTSKGATFTLRFPKKID